MTQNTKIMRMLVDSEFKMTQNAKLLQVQIRKRLKIQSDS